MEKYLRKSSSEEVRSRWRRYAVSTVNHPQRRFRMVVSLAMRSKTECKNRKFQEKTSQLEPPVTWSLGKSLQVVNTNSYAYPNGPPGISIDKESDAIVAARNQAAVDSSSCEPRRAPISALSTVTTQTASQAKTWGVRLFVYKAYYLAYMISSLWSGTEKDEGDAISEMTQGKQITIDVHSQVSSPVCPSHKIPQVLNTSSYSGSLSPRQTNHEGLENAAVITRDKQVVVDIPYSSSSLRVSSLDMNHQELRLNSSSCGPSRNYLGKKSGNLPGKETTIEITTPISQVARSLCETPQVLDTSSSSVGFSQNLADKVDSNGNAAVRGQINGDISDTILLPALIASQETNSSHIHPNNLSSEAQQTTSATASEDSGTTSQPAEQPTPAAVVTVSQARVPDFKTTAIIASTVLTISGGGIVSVLDGFVGEKKTDLTHKILFKAYTYLNYISFISAIGLLVVTSKPPSSPCFVMIIKITRGVTLGATASAFSCATSIIVAKSLDEVVIILVIPLVVSFLLVIFF